MDFDSSLGSVSLGTTKLTPGQALPAIPQGTLITLKALPNLPKAIFAGWDGTGTASVPNLNRTLQFTMGSSVAVMAKFAVNPFLTTNGSYYGLVTGDAKAVNGRGYATAKVTSSGVCTLSFNIGSDFYKVVRSLDDQGALIFAGVKATKGPNTASLNLQLDLLGAAKTFSGTVTVNGVGYSLTTNRAVFDTTLNPCPEAGTDAKTGKRITAHYVMVIPHPLGAGLPQGDGFGTLTVKPDGSVQFAGTLGDGTKASAGTFLGKDGEWPFFVSHIKRAVW